MSRRQTRRRGRAPSLGQRFQALFYGGSSRFDADRYTSSGGNVTAFVDYVDASHTLAVDTGTLPVPTADAAVNNQLSATFSAHRCRSSRAASAWRFLHDGTGCEAFCVATPTDLAAGQRTWFATENNTALPGDTGAEVFTDTGTAVFALVNNGAAPIAFIIGSAITAVPVTLGYASATSQTPLQAVFRRNSVTIANSNYGSAVATGDPTGTLGLGADTAGARFGSFRWCALYLFTRVLSTTERALVFQWIQSKYGIAP